MIGRQRQLLDKSLREGQGAGDPKDGGGKGLSAQQDRLREDLGRIEKGLGSRNFPAETGSAKPNAKWAMRRMRWVRRLSTSGPGAEERARSAEGRRWPARAGADEAEWTETTAAANPTKIRSAARRAPSAARERH